MPYRMSFIIIIACCNNMIACCNNMIDSAYTPSRPKPYRGVSKEPLREALKRMHPCIGVCSCACYKKNVGPQDRICDAGCEPLSDIRHTKQKPIYCAAHCQDHDCLSHEACQDRVCQEGLLDVLKGIFCGQPIYVAGSCRSQPAEHEDGHEKVKACCVKRVGILDRNHQDAQRIYILNPCAQSMK
jgi:hypothetical protein